ncbi:BspA family leucine-rich repeat surface protein, partial [Mycoplasmopsis bovis]|uniref:BspA family leucine-rich repeat surface protein n=1 Tax=Mycoplasmopsis bovis TaxID=28903 RepID=UPI003D2A3D47
MFRLVNFNSSLFDDTKNVTNMTAMFKGARFFNADLSRLNTANVKTKESMFEDAERFNNLIFDNVSKVKSMRKM